MKKTVLLLLLDRYADWEAAYLPALLLALDGEHFEVKTAAPAREPVRSMGGFALLPDYDFGSAPADFEALILIGGLSWRTETARQVLPLVRTAAKRGNVLGGICDAAAFLGTAGLLNDVRHTANDLDDLKQWAGAAYTGERLYQHQPAVRDRNIVTANGTATLEFAREVLTALGAAPESRIGAWYDFYKRGLYEAPMPR